MKQKEKKFNVDECNDVGILKGRIMFLESNMGCLSHQIGGYKTTNENYRKKVAELKERIEHYKKLDLEGDHLYEQSLVEIDNLKEKIREKDNVIKGLQSQMQEIITQNTGLKSVLKEKNDLIDELRKNIVELKTPWWKKIF